MARGSSRSYCSCALDTLQSQYSQKEYAAIEAEMQTPGKLPEPFAKTVLQVSLQCKQ